VHQKFGAFVKNGSEKGKSHDMIPVGMRENEMILEATFIKQLVAKPSNSGPRVHDDNIIAFGPDFDAGRISAVL